ncbi:hypothetical protein GTP81_24785 [Rugamonas sp. FT107W]|uniref:GPI inositol-deacylase PGAP1-like alpha/beta domain-containing protein n=1 Tax=Duganella vulcania TaxID=2692166 RepID=A0A845HSX7_9BURK|nr:hypothetical protein [Duganella vulcania]MYN19964.1 hypothetical protein [Duganella vulcania]
MASQLAVLAGANGIKAEGCCTPKEDQLPQKMSVPPTKVLPIIFLPGIMGSNLRISAVRQARLKKSNNIAWRPDRTGEALAMVNASAAKRQLQLDPLETEVDIYDPVTNPTGDRKETAAQRHDVGTIRVNLNPRVKSPLLTDDPIGAPNPKTKEMKAKERGWGEVYFDSYRQILEVCEEAFNQPWLTTHWARVFNRNPAEWGSVSQPALKVLLEKEHKNAVADCWFPVHAMGYNWLQSNGDSAKILGGRIRELIKKYRAQKYQCEKVILVTHSMGGLVARALIHPKMGGLETEVLGIVHGVMPAIGAPAAYKRMRSGFEEALGGFDPAPKVLGNFGSEVTAVLGNAQGGLELLPNKVYGNGWLEIRQNGTLLHSLPKKNNPYNEIYKLRGKWFNLLREDWLNPAELPGSGFDNTCDLLRGAEEFHDAIRDTYHSLSYAHYGADPARPSWERVVWNLELDKNKNSTNWQDLLIATDSRQGRLELSKTGEAPDVNVVYSIDGIESVPLGVPGALGASLGKSSGPGDQTVPLRSAVNQLQSGKFQGIFQQQGYEHQASYSNIGAVESTLYSLSRIIGTMKWTGHV